MVVVPSQSPRTSYSPDVAGSTPRVGVLALQGAFREHVQALERLGATAVEVRTPAELDGLDGLMLATVGDEPVAVRSGSIMAATFHPELAHDDRLHARFLERVTTHS